MVPIVWTFTIVDAAEVTFDPANSVIPFPIDAVRTGKGGTVALPNPKTGAPLTVADCETADTSILLVCGLNTLDGFSTQVSPISENSDTLGAIEQGLIDATSLDAKTVGLVPLASTAPAAEKTAPNFTPCLNCMSSPNAAGTPQTSPQQLQWKLNAPLDEEDDVHRLRHDRREGRQGNAVIANPVFALLRSKTPLVDAGGKATVNILSDAQAKQLEPLRAAFAPAFDGLEEGRPAAREPRARLPLHDAVGGDGPRPALQGAGTREGRGPARLSDRARRCDPRLHGRGRRGDHPDRQDREALRRRNAHAGPPHRYRRHASTPLRRSCRS